ncbi:MAG: hypothetical protein RLZZ78_1929 [Armatimonadota bacterium]|jgi:hypothetical protein
MNENDEVKPGVPDEQPQQVSRRDFLRRATTDAAKTGMDVLPGAKLANTVVKTPWWKSIATWKSDRTKSEEEK